MLQLLPLVASILILPPAQQTVLDTTSTKTTKTPTEKTSIELKVSKELKAFSDWMGK